MILAGETDELGRNKDLLCLQLSLLGTWWGVGDGALSLQLMFLTMSRASCAWSAVLVKWWLAFPLLILFLFEEVSTTAPPT